MSVHNLNDALKWKSYFSVSRDSHGVPKDVYLNNGIHADRGDSPLRRSSVASGDSSRSTFYPAPHEHKSGKVKANASHYGKEDSGLSGTRSSSRLDDTAEESRTLSSPDKAPEKRRSRAHCSADYRVDRSTPRSSQNPSRRRVGQRLETALEYESKPAPQGDDLSRGTSVGSSCQRFPASLGGGGALFTPVLQYLSRTGSVAGRATPSNTGTMPKRPSKAFRPQSSPSDRRDPSNDMPSTSTQSGLDCAKRLFRPPRSGSAVGPLNASSSSSSDSDSNSDSADPLSSPIHVHIRSGMPHPTVRPSRSTSTTAMSHKATGKRRSVTNSSDIPHVGANHNTLHARGEKVKKVLLYSRTGDSRGSYAAAARPLSQRCAHSSPTSKLAANIGSVGSGSSIGEATRAAAAAARASMMPAHRVSTPTSPSYSTSSAIPSAKVSRTSEQSSGVPRQSNDSRRTSDVLRTDSPHRDSRSVSSESSGSSHSPPPEGGGPSPVSRRTKPPKPPLPSATPVSSQKPPFYQSQPSQSTCSISSDSSVQKSPLTSARATTSTEARGGSPPHETAGKAATSLPVPSADLKPEPKLQKGRPELNQVAPEDLRPQSSPPSPPPRSSSTTSAMAGSTPSETFLTKRATLLREEGNDYFRRNNFTSAVRLYSLALALDQFNEVLLCNRSAAYCGAFNYTAALVDAKFAILVAPQHAKGYWRAGKALLALNLLEESRNHYGQALERCSPPNSCNSDGTSSTGRHTQDYAAIKREMDAICVAERFHSHLKAARWPEATLCARQLVKEFRTGPSTMMSFTLNELMAKLHTEPQSVLQTVKGLVEECADCAALYMLYAKAVFYCAHDEESTRRVLHLLDLEKDRLGFQNEVVQENIRDFAQRVQQKPHLKAKLDKDAWEIQYRVVRSTESEQLLRCVQQFIKYRDEGNRAYMLSEWSTAYAAYTRCLQLDPHNRSLLGATYCNRAAVAIQQERWNDALKDCSEALNLQTQNAKAFARRARVYLRFFRDLADTKSDSMFQKQLYFINAAIDDLKKSIAHTTAGSPASSGLKEQLRQAMETRQQLTDHRGGGSAGASRFKDHHRSSTSSEGYGCGSAASDGPRGSFSRGTDFSSSGKGSRPDLGSGYRPSSGASYFPGGFQSSSGSNTSNHNFRSRGSNANTSGETSKPLTLEQHLRRLGLSGRPDLKAVGKAYRECALKWHPDKWCGRSDGEKKEAEKHFKEINMSYQLVKESFSQ